MKGVEALFLYALVNLLKGVREVQIEDLAIELET